MKMKGPQDKDHARPDLQEAPQGKSSPQRAKILEIWAKAIESLLMEGGLVSVEALDRVLLAYENEMGPMEGAKVVARAWTDPLYKKRLLEDATQVVGELEEGVRLVVVENTPQVHNVVVCRLCSCYPWPLLGLPPFWYKSPSYRLRVAGKPREVLREFGLELPRSAEVQVWNSSAETRYMVLPQRPEGTEGMGEEELAALVSRDALIGVSRVGAKPQVNPYPPDPPIVGMKGETALPRKNGALVFQDPWEGCAFALAAALYKKGLFLWEEFQNLFAGEMASAPSPQKMGGSYYEHWLTALEKILVKKRILTQRALEARRKEITQSSLAPYPPSLLRLLGRPR